MQNCSLDFKFGHHQLESRCVRCHQLLYNAPGHIEQPVALPRAEVSPAYFPEAQMKNICILIGILCGCLFSLAWGQQPANDPLNNWSEFHRSNMARYNPSESVLN